jgi:hypothetical protein
MLPEAYDTPVLWSQAQLEEVKGTPLYGSHLSAYGDGD